ncbi:hypothetical protein KP509_32G056800 [Ceratopteris richardii]|uniref:Uncharacterized protein n=1 Tax=Ceratopteris richardii TaxID=49495 RepID=A0A8T2QTU5_CERRI|nr:hypothetical protein KP509_32G056800 [Ceratopteris richardii]
MAWRRVVNGLATPLATLAAIQQSYTVLLEPAHVKVKEPFTGVEFDRRRDILQPEAKGDYHLLATAVRCMLGQCKFAKARAYAIGLYATDVDEGLWKADEDARYQALLSMHSSRNLILVVDQDVGGHHIAKGFDRSLLPRIRKAQGGKAGPGKDALREFTRCFSKERKLHKGTEIFLVWRPDDTLVVMIDSSLQVWSLRALQWIHHTRQRTSVASV